MYKQYIFLVMSILFFTFICNGVFASDKDLSEAIQHAEAAARAMDAKSIVENAVIAKEHANVVKESVKNLSSPGAGDNDLDSAIKYLDQAIEKGNLEDTHQATIAAESAVQFLKRFE